jgi:Domain of unknown function (DUF222)/HNH endonuclease
VFESPDWLETAEAVDGLRAALDMFVVLQLDRLSRDELLELARLLEAELRRTPVVQHALVAELDARGVAAEFAVRDTAGLLVDMLRLSRGEAKGRVRSAADLGRRREPNGAILPPLFAAVAAAQAGGSISATHARLITAILDRLPAAVAIEHGGELETFLVAQAQLLDPHRLGQLARRVVDTLDPDGTRASDRDHERRRSLSLRLNRDGSADLTARLTPSCAAVWQSVLDPLAAPVQADDGDIDARTAPQRAHDGLLDAGLRLLRSGDLPDAGGVPVTVQVSITTHELQTSSGLASTAHGGLMSIPELLNLATDAQLLPVILNDAGGIVAYGRTRRLPTAAQRLALTARDGGCSFPGCSAPAVWCQTHHVISWTAGGTTDLDNLTLLCGLHHREHEKRGWTCHMVDGVPWWHPPRWIDPAQQPRRNQAPHIVP